MADGCHRGPAERFPLPAGSGAGSSIADSGQVCLQSTGYRILSSTVQVVPWQTKSSPCWGRCFTTLDMEAPRSRSHRAQSDLPMSPQGF